MTATEVPIVPWNARTTYFEFRVGSAMDTSEGVTKTPSTIGAAKQGTK